MNKEQALQELYAQINQNSENFDLYRLLRNKYSFLIPDMTELENYLQDMNVSEIEKLNTIKALIETKRMVEDTREHTKGFVEKPFEVFCKLFPNLNLCRSKFYELYKPMISIKISNSLLKFNDKSMKIIEILKSLNIDSLKALYVLAKDIKITIDKFCNSFQLVKSEEKMMVKELFKILKNYKAIFVYEALCILLIDEEHNDICIENKILYYNIFSNIQDYQNTIVIYNPNLLFIDNFVNDNAIDNKGSTLFVVENAMIKEIINFKYKFLNVCTFDSFISYIDDNVLNIENSLLLFNTNTIINKDTILSKILEKSETKKSIVFSADSFLRSTSPKYNVSQITLFPDGINYCTLPERKALFTINKGESKLATLSKYSLKNDEKHQYISLKANQYEVDLKNLNSTIRSYFDSKEKESDSDRTKAGIRKPAKEISIYWNSSDPDENGYYDEIRMYVKEPILKDGKVIEGSKVNKSVRKTTKKITLLEFDDLIINEYLDKTASKEYIRNTYIPLLKKLYKGKEVTLRFLLITYPEFIDSLNHEQKEIYEITCKSDLYDSIPSKIDLEQIDYCADTLLKNDELSIIFKSFLNKLFLFSIDNGYSSNNPLKYDIKRIIKEEKRINDIIRNLSTSRISDESTSTFIDKCKDCIFDKKHEYIGALLRITTSLSNQLIRALKWCDFEKVTVGTVTFYRLKVRRQISKDNKEYISLSKETQYILIPLPSVVSSIMEKCWKEIVNKNPYVPENELRQKPIVPGEDNFIDGYGILSYYHLDSIVNKIIEKNKLIPKKKIYMLRKDNNLFLQELSTVDTDIFRIFYKNRCEDFKIDSNESCYLLGNKPYDTYAIFYCDFENDFSQLILYKKIERMFSRITTKENKTARKVKSIGNLSYITSNSNRSELTIDVKNMKKISINIHHGCKLRINELEENKND